VFFAQMLAFQSVQYGTLEFSSILGQSKPPKICVGETPGTPENQGTLQRTEIHFNHSLVLVKSTFNRSLAQFRSSLLATLQFQLKAK
jgi:hypothetical protein